MERTSLKLWDNVVTAVRDVAVNRPSKSYYDFPLSVTTVNIAGSANLAEVDGGSSSVGTLRYTKKTPPTVKNRLICRMGHK
jgi:hypothetical protein